MTWVDVAFLVAGVLALLVAIGLPGVAAAFGLVAIGTPPALLYLVGSCVVLVAVLAKLTTADREVRVLRRQLWTLEDELRDAESHLSIVLWETALLNGGVRGAGGG